MQQEEKVELCNSVYVPSFQIKRLLQKWTSNFFSLMSKPHTRPYTIIFCELANVLTTIFARVWLSSLFRDARRNWLSKLCENKRSLRQYAKRLNFNELPMNGGETRIICYGMTPFLPAGSAIMTVSWNEKLLNCRHDRQALKAMSANVTFKGSWRVFDDLTLRVGRTAVLWTIQEWEQKHV